MKTEVDYFCLTRKQKFFTSVLSLKQKFWDFCFASFPEEKTSVFRKKVIVKTF